VENIDAGTPQKISQERTSGRDLSKERIKPTFDMTELFLADLPKGEEQRARLCRRSSGDRVRSLFCGSTAPQIGSLKELLATLGLAHGVAPGTTGLDTQKNGTGNFAMLANSTSLVGRATSAINPRLIYFTKHTPKTKDPNLLSASFLRGDQFVEVIARNPNANFNPESDLSFYLIHFTQDCNSRPGGCVSGELLGPGVETDWRSVTVYEDHDLENTVFDCKHCHQPGGPGTPKFMRMQELPTPWTHYFSESGGNTVLFNDFLQAHDGEEYGGVPSSVIRGSNPAVLEQIMRDNGFFPQPNEFPSHIIENINTLRNQDRRLAQQRTPDGKPKAWAQLYEKFQSGLMIPPPSYKVQVGDQGKLREMAQVYRRFVGGGMTAAELPDIREIYSEEDMRDTGLMVSPNASAQEILLQACAQCHNPRLNKSISRARFDATNINAIDEETRGRVIERMLLDKKDPQLMPPAKFRQLTDDEIRKVQDLLGGI
jgi:mono/diheme cytochrome c family protein